MFKELKTKLISSKREVFRQQLNPSRVTPARATPLHSGLFFRFTFCGRVTPGRVVRDCETIFGLKKITLKKSRVVWQSYWMGCCVCQQTVTSCQMRFHVFVCFVVLRIIMVMIIVNIDYNYMINYGYNKNIYNFILKNYSSFSEIVRNRRTNGLVKHL